MTTEKYQALLKAVRAFERANTEYRRARNAGEQPRLSNAGTRYAVAKWRVFQAANEATPAPPPPDEPETK